MTRISWGAVSDRIYESGVDRGVLYVPNQVGVAWNGLVSVEEAPTGGDPQPYYFDGIKYLNLTTREEFEATINALSSPKEFGPCDGVAQLQAGLFATQQPRQSFGLSYRTMIYNAVGDTIGYKIHLVYNALTAPSSRSNKTLSDSGAPDALNWKITTLPPVVAGYRPTSHFIIDSRYTQGFQLSSVEDILYGNVSAAPRLPDASELIFMFSALGYPPLKAVLISTNVYEIHEVDLPLGRAVMSATHPVTPAIGEDPILWFDTSAGNYAIPKLVMGG